MSNTNSNNTMNSQLMMHNTQHSTSTPKNIPSDDKIFMTQFFFLTTLLFLAAILFSTMKTWGYLSKKRKMKFFLKKMKNEKIEKIEVLTHDKNGIPVLVRTDKEMRFF